MTAAALEHLAELAEDAALYAEATDHPGVAAVLWASAEAARTLAYLERHDAAVLDEAA